MGIIILSNVGTYANANSLESTPQTSAAVIKSGWTKNAATIDGIVSGEEWEDAEFTVVRAWNDSSDAYRDFQIWIMNDKNYIYLRALVNDDTADDDSFFVALDEAADGNFTTFGLLEEFIAFWLNGVPSHDEIHDGYGHNQYLYQDDSISDDSIGSYAWSSTNYIIELKIPLRAADQEDLQASAGDLIGIAFGFYSGYTGTKVFGYPDNCTKVNEHKAVSFQLAADPSSDKEEKDDDNEEPTVTIGTPINVIILLGFIFSATLITKLRLKKRIK